MKYLFGLLFLISFCNKSKAADTLITKFINSIYTQVIDSGQNHYYLFERGTSPTEFGSEKIDFSLKNTIGIPGMPKNIPFEDFKNAIKKDTTSINWDEYGLKNAQIVDVDHLYCQFYKVLNVTYNTPDSILKKPLQKCEVKVLIKPGMSKSEIDSADSKAIDEYNHRPGMVEDCWYFSKPVFSKNGKYALISVDSNHSGRIFVFKLMAHKWMKILTFGFYNT